MNNNLPHSQRGRALSLRSASAVGPTATVRAAARKILRALQIERYTYDDGAGFSTWEHGRLSSNFYNLLFRCDRPYFFAFDLRSAMARICGRVRWSSGGR